MEYPFCMLTHFSPYYIFMLIEMRTLMFLTGLAREKYIL